MNRILSTAIHSQTPRLGWLAGLALVLLLLAAGCAHTEKTKTVDYGYGMDFTENPVP